MNFSVVIPAYNEAETIETFVWEFISRFSSFPLLEICEIVIVENGSTDSTIEACQRLADSSSGLVRVLSNKRGSYGEAIKRGMLETKGTHVSILECDFLDLGFVAASAALFEDPRSRFIVASKRHPDSQDLRPIKRRILTRVFNWILRLFLGYPGSDTHGLKSVEAQLAKQLCGQALTTDETFQTEFVLLAWRQGIRIDELPIMVREMRATPLSIHRRFPMVIHTVRELRRSLRRFPPRLREPYHGEM
jgi:glycosyltransferase AglD